MVIVQGAKVWGEFHRGQLSREELSRGNYLGAIVRGAKVWGVIVLGGISWGKFSGGQLSRGEMPGYLLIYCNKELLCLHFFFQSWLLCKLKCFTQ